MSWKDTVEMADYIKLQHYSNSVVICLLDLDFDIHQVCVCMCVVVRWHMLRGLQTGVTLALQHANAILRLVRHIVQLVCCVGSVHKGLAMALACVCLDRYGSLTLERPRVEIFRWTREAQYDC